MKKEGRFRLNVPLTCPCTAAAAGAASPSLRSCTGSQPAPEPPLHGHKSTPPKFTQSASQLIHGQTHIVALGSACYLSLRRAPRLNSAPCDKLRDRGWRARGAPGGMLLLRSAHRNDTFTSLQSRINVWFHSIIYNPSLSVDLREPGTIWDAPCVVFGHAFKKKQTTTTTTHQRGSAPKPCRPFTSIQRIPTPLYGDVPDILLCTGKRSRASASKGAITESIKGVRRKRHRCLQSEQQRQQSV